MSEPYREPSDPLCGAILDGRYRVAEVVGVGGMGVVYRAQQVSAHGRDVAIKVLSSHALGTSSVTQRFETEARIIAQLRHPNTLKMIDSGRFSDGRLYIVTEFLSGRPLIEIQSDLARNPLRTLRIMRQVCDSLAEAHELGIVHRDLKPSNIYLEAVAGQEIVKVLDFGLAKLLEVPGLTLPMRICGTPGFMAPEQICGQPIDGRADVYALGAVLYETISGEPPFIAEDINALLMKHVTCTPVPLSSFDLDFPVDHELDALVMRMLAKDPEERPQSVLEVRSTLNEIELRLVSHDFSDRLPASRAASAASHPAADGLDLDGPTTDDVVTSPSTSGIMMSFPPERIESNGARSKGGHSTPVEAIGAFDFATPRDPQDIVGDAYLDTVRYLRDDEDTADGRTAPTATGLDDTWTSDPAKTLPLDPARTLPLDPAKDLNADTEPGLNNRSPTTDDILPSDRRTVESPAVEREPSRLADPPQDRPSPGSFNVEAFGAARTSVITRRPEEKQGGLWLVAILGVLLAAALVGLAAYKTFGLGH